MHVVYANDYCVQVWYLKNKQFTTATPANFMQRRVSLIAGLEYGMEQWNGKWNGMVNVHNYS